MEPFFRPRSIAVVGASRAPGTIGHQILHNLITHGYQGVVYPVNPQASAVHSIPAYPSVEDIPGPVDLAVVVVPKGHVPDVVESCGRKGVPALVVISAGFREVGGDGVEREEALMEQVRRFGMRLVGPNCMGLLNTDPALSMNATFAPTMPPGGTVSFLSQSGALGVTILDYAAELGIGIRNFVSVGNKPDVSGNDLLEYWEGEDGTDVILMYLETFGNPKKFTQLARRVTRRKPIVVVKSGRSVAGARAASSHTGSLAGADDTVDALLAQCGVLRADTVQDLFDLAVAFSTLKPPKGDRVAIVTNAGGPGIMTADACEALGLRVAELSPETQDRLRELLPEEASVGNPVDLVASATAESYKTVLDLVLHDPEVDAAIAAFVPPLGVRQVDVAGALVDASEGADGKPLLAVLMGREGLPEGRNRLREAGVPAYIFPESAAQALAALHRYGRWLERPPEEPRSFPVERERVAGILDAAWDEGRRSLTEPETLGVLAAYGIPVVEHFLTSSAEEAVERARQIGFPVVLKLVSPEIAHKSDVGGVRVDLRTEEEVREAYQKIRTSLERNRPDARVDGILVTRFVEGARETIVGMTLDPAFGPVLMFGLGGIYVETLGDVAFRVHPVTDRDAREMVRSIRSYPLLEGTRGGEAVDQEALVQVIQRVSQLVGEHDRIHELDVNPFLIGSWGGVAVDGHMGLGPAGPMRSKPSSRPTTSSVGPTSER